MNQPLHICGLPNSYGFGLTVDNVNEALPLGLQLVKERGVEVTSRGITTLEVPGPVTTIYRTPQRRVLFDEVRDANPFFHLVESMWVLAGSESLALPKYFLGRYADFSDDGITLHGAYGYRLRHWEFADNERLDQLLDVVRLLQEKPDTRQAVLSIWDPVKDLGIRTKDMPCNDMVMLSIRNGHLFMTVCNRSNDVIWGAYGANAVQFSILQEWIAVMVGAEVGYYVQQSNSYHVYPDNPFWKNWINGNHDSGHVYNPYMSAEMDVSPLVTTPAEGMALLRDCEVLDSKARLGEPLTSGSYDTGFFNRVLVPMINAYDSYKRGDYWNALDLLRYVDAPDWRFACTAWVMRRKERADAQRATQRVPEAFLPPVDSEGGEA